MGKCDRGSGTLAQSVFSAHGQAHGVPVDPVASRVTLMPRDHHEVPVVSRASAAAVFCDGKRSFSGFVWTWCADGNALDS